MGQRKNQSFATRCEQVIEFFKDYHFQYEANPSYQEIVAGIGIKSKGGQLKPIIDHLVAEGQLEKIPGTARGVRLPRHGLLSIPFKGIIAADNINPEMLLDHDPHDVLELLSELLPDRRERSKIYALKVRGDSMEYANIKDGDTILMREGDQWKEGDIVAVWLADEGAATLKEIQPGREGTVKLIPKSHKQQIRIEEMQNIKVLGRLVSVIRRYNQSQKIDVLSRTKKYPDELRTSVSEIGKTELMAFSLSIADISIS